MATSLNSLARLYEAQGRYADAEPLYERSLAIREKVLGPNHTDVATSLNSLAGLYQEQGRYDHRAEPSCWATFRRVTSGKVYGALRFG